MYRLPYLYHSCARLNSIHSIIKRNNRQNFIYLLFDIFLSIEKKYWRLFDNIFLSVVTLPRSIIGLFFDLNSAHKYIAVDYPPYAYFFFYVFVFLRLSLSIRLDERS
jgi:hypothetical protein